MTDHDDDPKTPLDHTLDVLVFLPIGFVLDFPRSIPRYIDRGRRQLDPSRLLASGSGRGPAGRLDRLHAHTRNTLKALGVHDDDAGTNGRSEPGDPARPAVTDAAPAAPAAPRLVPVASGIDPETLAITDYDSLSASQVVPRLDSLGSDELESIRQYELGSRGRKTILNKIAQLQAG